MQTLTVKLKDNSYPVQIGWGILEKLGPRLLSFTFSKNCLIISNPTVYALYGDTVRAGLEEAGFTVNYFLIPDGEQAKSLDIARGVYDALIENGMDRWSPVIALGGGVVGDLAGFAAATYMRGIPYIQVPTTLLAQVDSSIGGKVAINHSEGKNLIGSFYQPKLVWTDLKTLTSLPERELRAGMAEVVKYGVIWDADFFAFLERVGEKIFDLEKATLAQIVKRSCEIKSVIVGRDEKEAGIRAILNYGHTFAHILEAVTDYRLFRHGEAVAIGMVAVTRLALKLDLCRNQLVLKRQKDLLQALGLKREFPQGYDLKKMSKILLHDKKIRNGTLNLILPSHLGEVLMKKLPEQEVSEFLACLAVNKED